MTALPSCLRPILRRWLKFNFVGSMGICVHLLAVFIFGSVLDRSSLVATALAVEAAILHNFVWHEHFTWADRRSDALPRAPLLVRLLAFNCTTGAVSIGGNLLLVSLLIARSHFPLLLANCVAIAACSLLNFIANDQVVFRAPKQFCPEPVQRFHGNTAKQSASQAALFQLCLLRRIPRYEPDRPDPERFDRGDERER